MSNNPNDDYIGMLIKFIGIFAIAYCFIWFFIKLRLS